MTDLEFRSALTLELDVVVLYRLLRLRGRELDGRDLEPGARQLWLERHGEIVATVRVLRETDGTARIDGLCTVPAERDTGAAAYLMDKARELLGDVPYAVR